VSFSSENSSVVRMGPADGTSNSVLIVTNRRAADKRSSAGPWGAPNSPWQSRENIVSGRRWLTSLAIHVSRLTRHDEAR